MKAADLDYDGIAAFLQAQIGDGICIAGVTGSFAAGLANATSDLDVFVVLEDRFCERNVASYFQAFRNDDWALDVLIVRRSEWTRVVAAIDATIFGYLSEQGRLIEKLMNAHVFAGRAQFDTAVTPQIRAVFQRRLFEGHRSIAMSIYEDYVGALTDMEPVQVTELLQEVLRCELECALIASGDCYRKPKWISKRLLRSTAVPRRFYDTFRDAVLRPPALGTAAWHDWRKQIHGFHRAVQYHLLFKDAAVASIAITDILESGESPIGSPNAPAFVFALADRYFFRGTGTPFQISQRIAWLACQLAGPDTPPVIQVPQGARRLDIRSAYLELEDSGLLL